MRDLINRVITEKESLFLSNKNTNAILVGGWCNGRTLGQLEFELKKNRLIIWAHCSNGVSLINSSCYIFDAHSVEFNLIKSEFKNICAFVKNKERRLFQDNSRFELMLNVYNLINCFEKN